MARFRLDSGALLRFLIDVMSSLRQGPLVRVVLACVVGTAAAFGLNAAIVLAIANNCLGADGLSHPSALGSGYWYDQVQTGPCSGTTYCYSTQGGKANLTTWGNPSTNDNAVQHVLVALGSKEQNSPQHCKAIAKGYDGCWIQTGWITGTWGSCNPFPNNTQTITTIDVYVEIFDDSSAPCLEGDFGITTSDASYDARYYSLVGSLHRYEAYYQPNNSSTIQVLAYGDYTDQTTAEIVGGEVLAPTYITSPHCPVLGQNTIGNWNFVGYSGSNSFASQVQLYTGSWANWTTSVAPHTTPYVNAPYTYLAITNFTTDFSRWMNGGS